MGQLFSARGLYGGTVRLFLGDENQRELGTYRDKPEIKGLHNKALLKGNQWLIRPYFLGGGGIC